MRKRQKFILTSVVLGACLALVHSFGLEIRYGMITLLAILTWIMAAWSLKEGLSGVEWLTVPLPPAVLSLGVGLFYILLPTFWLYRVAIIIIFGICQYALLLTANIFSVAAIRTIALLRTAHVVGVMMMLLSAFLLFNTILSFRLDFWLVGLLVTIVGLVLYLPTLWSVNLEERLQSKLWLYTIFMAILCGFLAMMLSFWPMNFSVESLFLVTYMYVTVGIVQNYYQDKLFARTVWEYVVWGGVVMITALVKTFF